MEDSLCLYKQNEPGKVALFIIMKIYHICSIIGESMEVQIMLSPKQKQRILKKKKKADDMNCDLFALFLLYIHSFGTWKFVSLYIGYVEDEE